MFHVEHLRSHGLRAEYQEQAQPGQIYSGVSDPMLRGYRSIVAALGGLALWSQSPRAQGVPSPSPAPKEQPSQSAQSGNGKPKPLAVAIVESPEQAKADERREAEGKRHDASDLDAQIRAANAAEEQILPAWLAALLSFAGTGLIVWTLYLTRKANEIAKEGQRAWLSISPKLKLPLEPYQAQAGAAYRVEVSANIKNYGSSPGLQVFFDVGTDLALGAGLKELKNFMSRWASDRGAAGEIIFPGDTIEMGFNAAIFERDVADAENRLLNKFVNPTIFLCLTYRLIGSTEFRQTGMICHLTKMQEIDRWQMIDVTAKNWWCEPQIVLTSGLHTLAT